MRACRRWAWWWLLWVAYSGPSFAQSARGFTDLRLTAFPGASGKKLQVVEWVRPSMESELAERVKLVVTVDAALVQGRNTTEELGRTLRAQGLGTLWALSPQGQQTFANRALRINDADDYLDVDRLHLDFYAGAADVRVGRQALNWGSAQFFNPTDPFPQVLLAEPWRPRRGVNAVRTSVPFGELNDFSAVVASNDTFTALRAAGRVRVNWNETDFAVVGAWRGDNQQALVGLDLRGTLELGWWVEAAYLLGHNPHEEVAIGVDYSFPVLERATAFLQYYRNGAGSTAPSPLSRVGDFTAASGQPDPFAPFTAGRDYLLVGTSLMVLPELSVNLAALQNLNDSSGVVIPTVSYQLFGFWDLSASAQLPYALRPGGGEFRPSASAMRVVVPAPAPLGPLSADLSGLLPDATVTVWTRFSF